MTPREVAFAVIGGFVGALLGWVAAAALHQSRIAGIVVAAVMGIGVGIGVWRYLSQKARLRDAPAVRVTDTLKR